MAETRTPGVPPRRGDSLCPGGENAMSFLLTGTRALKEGRPVRARFSLCPWDTRRASTLRGNRILLLISHAPQGARVIVLAPPWGDKHLEAKRLAPSLSLSSQRLSPFGENEKVSERGCCCCEESLWSVDA